MGGSRTLRVCAIELPNGFQCIISVVIGDKRRALRPSGTIVEKLELDDGSYLVEKSLYHIRNCLGKITTSHLRRDRLR